MFQLLSYMVAAQLLSHLTDQVILRAMCQKVKLYKVVMLVPHTLTEEISCTYLAALLQSRSL